MKSRARYWLNLFALTFLSLCLAVFIILAYAGERSMQAYLHPARFAPSDAFLKANNIPYQEIELTTQDGVKLSAWYTPPQNGVVILAAHGLSGNRAQVPYALFASHGYGVIAWDFRAHGKSGGDFSTIGYLEQLDVEAALNYARTQPNVKHIGAWGGSMGAAAVILAAAKHPEIEAVVSDSAYPALEDAMRISIPNGFLQPLYLSTWEFLSGADLNRIRPVDEIAQISPRAVFIIDGWAGGAIAMNSPYRLYDAAREPKQIWVEKGVPHLGMYGTYPEAYAEKVIAFFDGYLLGQ